MPAAVDTHYILLSVGSPACSDSEATSPCVSRALAADIICCLASMIKIKDSVRRTNYIRIISKL